MHLFPSRGIRAPDIYEILHNNKPDPRLQNRPAMKLPMPLLRVQGQLDHDLPFRSIGKQSPEKNL